MKAQKNKLIITITIGFALFAMFFGAGNLILPPYIGLNSGNQWVVSLIGFFITAIAAPLLGILVVAKSGISFTDLGQKIPPKLVNTLSVIIILCIGPLVAIPRTGATTFEIGIQPIFPQISNLVASSFFFLIVLVLSLTKSNIVNIIGKILTPFLLFSLLVLLCLGILYPAKSVDINHTQSLSESFTFGFVEGYQTLDVLAAVIFAGIIISAVIDSGYTSTKERLSITISASLIASLSLLFIYGGLIYLGATSDYVWSENASRTDLLLHISTSVLGKTGMYIISTAIAFACLTTAIALTCSTGMIFEKLSKGKIAYKLGVILCTIISFFLSVKSVDEIIKYAVNILLFIYPITFTLILSVLLLGRVVKSRFPFVMAILTTAVISLISVFENLNLQPEFFSRIKQWLPLSNFKLEWLLPSLIVLLIASFSISQKNKKDVL